MLMLTSQVPEISTHIFDPVSEQLSRYIINRLGCHDIVDNRIYINSDHLSASKTTDNDHKPILKDNRYTCEVRENLDPLNTKWAMASSQDFIGNGIITSRLRNREPVFYDELTRTHLIEHFVPSGITLTAKLSFVDRVIAYDIASRLRTIFQNGSLITTTDHSYTYKVPEDIFTVLHQLYTMRIDPNPPEEPYNTFFQWLRRYSNSYMSVNTNRDDNRSKELVVRRLMGQIVSQIDYDEEKPVVHKTEKSADWWDVNFTITTQFARPDSLHLFYPIIVSNTPIPSSIIPIDNAEQHRTPMSAYRYYDIHKYKTNNLDTQYMECIQYPWYDMWSVPQHTAWHQYGFRSFLVVALVLDDVDNPEGVSTIDLSEPFFGRELTDEVLDVIREAGGKCLFQNERFNIAIYRNDRIMDPESYTLDGTILTLPYRDINHVYRLVLSQKKGDNYGYCTTFRVANVNITANQQ